jgi:hypothetical protein
MSQGDLIDRRVQNTDLPPLSTVKRAPPDKNRISPLACPVALCFTAPPPTDLHVIDVGDQQAELRTSSEPASSVRISRSGNELMLAASFACDVRILCVSACSGREKAQANAHPNTHTSPDPSSAIEFGSYGSLLESDQPLLDGQLQQ